MGGGRPPEQHATLRLEPLVDAGLLTRRDRFSYRYLLSDPQRTFFEQLSSASSAEEFVETRLFGCLARGRSDEAAELEEGEAWESIQDAYRSLRSGLGYASFREVIALANARLSETHPGSYFELARGVEILRERQREMPRQIRFGATRGGGITYVRLNLERGAR